VVLHWFSNLAMVGELHKYAPWMVKFFSNYLHYNERVSLHAGRGKGTYTDDVGETGDVESVFLGAGVHSPAFCVDTEVVPDLDQLVFIVVSQTQAEDTRIDGSHKQEAASRQILHIN